MAVYKVCLAGEELINLESDTVTPEALLAGHTAHDAGGNPITGTLEPEGETEYSLIGTYVLGKIYGLLGSDISLSVDPFNAYTYFYTENGWEYLPISEISFGPESAVIYSLDRSASKVASVNGEWQSAYGEFPDDRYLIVDFKYEQWVELDFHIAFLDVCAFGDETAFDIGVGVSAGGSVEPTDEEYTLYGTYLLTDNPPNDILTLEEIIIDASDSEVYTYLYNSTDGWFYDKVVGLIAIGNVFALGGDTETKFSNDGVWSNSYEETYTDERYKIIDFKTPVQVSKEFYDIFIRYIDNNATTSYEIGLSDGIKGAIESAVEKTVDINTNGTTVIYDVDGSVMSKVTVNVDVPTGGGGSSEELESLIGMFTGDTEDFVNTSITKLGGKYTFAYSSFLKTVSLPNCASSVERAFSNCDSMTSLSMPKLTSAPGTYFAAYCGALKTADIPDVSTVSSYCFYSCANLTKLEFNRITNIYGNAFNGCTKLAALIIRRSSVVSLSATSAFTNTKIAGSGGYIYVPSALVESYKTATNWSTYSAKFRAIEDYPDICG